MNVNNHQLILTASFCCVVTRPPVKLEIMWQSL